MHRRSISILAILLTAPACADEGMWTFGNFPQAQVKQKYGADITDGWLQRLQRSVVRLEGGCTGSFISGDGLILTNHHCAMGCLADLSSAGASYVEDGFNATTRAQERRCPARIVSVLVEVEEVTDKLQAATAGLADAKANEVRKQELSRLEASCAGAAKTPSSAKQNQVTLACESVSLYQGGQYFLYKYQRYDDVRMAFAPHQAIGAFGGDPDNFNFPRWSLDFGLLRVYENGRPARTPNHLQWRAEGPRAGELVFIAGHPGSTNRLLTIEQLKFQRDVMPSSLIRSAELRGRLIQWGKTGAEPQRIVQENLQSYENSLKIQRGRQRALLDDSSMARNAKEERELRERVAADPKLSARVGDAWEDVATAMQRYRQIYDRHMYLEGGAGFSSTFFAYAKRLVRGAAERAKPNELRLREYADSNLPKIEAGLLAATPVYPDYEQLTLSFSLDKMREALGPDDPVVRELLSRESPESLAAKLIEGTRLADPAVRQALWKGGLEAIERSPDPMIALARSIDSEARALRKVVEDEV
ncbi:MAG: S46 family peptidase, partial [Steroidobacteraceae bacterium]